MHTHTHTHIHTHRRTHTMRAQGKCPGNVVSPSLAPALLELGRTLVGLAARDALTRARRVLNGSPAAAAQMVCAHLLLVAIVSSVLA
jgi:hypothetical protein